MEKSKKRTIIQGIVCAVLLCLIWGGYFCLMKWVVIIPREDDFSWVYQVDKVQNNNEELMISGFAFQSMGDAVGDNYEVILHDLESQKNYFLKMKYTDRSDVNQYFSGQYDYLKSGFVATIETNKIDASKNYELFLRVAGTQKAYKTGTYLSNGKLMYTDPCDYVPLSVEGTDLEDIVEHGFLRVYRPDYGIYVYQYNGELYWIADSEYAFDEDGDVYLQYLMTTTQEEKLPLKRRQAGWDLDDRAFSFGKNEMVEWNTGNYRVAKQTLSDDYSLERIWTGEFTGVWVWRHDFRPYYEFE